MQLDQSCSSSAGWKSGAEIKSDGGQIGDSFWEHSRLFSTSKHSVPPNINVNFSVMNIAGIENVPTMDRNFNLRTFLVAPKNFIILDNDERMRGTTLREVCRSFANFALEYYNEDMERMGNLAEKILQLALLARVCLTFQME
ncbi:unnamed protein product [Cuscuta epithymum]|uniref:Uncharacterized protein n=1 Tax=Cuscuta epithymum TaxID=186058 RepID=A0AAV0FQZ0_9ASTE|nr:unnamed protein product [Cuscuta epithymum]